jgi:dihydropteroate synthase
MPSLTRAILSPRRSNLHKKWGRARRLLTAPGWVLGVINVTPDSFYPASRGTTLKKALTLATQFANDGADGLDVGAESTRPGARTISNEEEMRRLLPAIDAMRQRFPNLPLSVDTRKAVVARAALSAGADLINDISAFQYDPAMAEVAAETKAPVILMHMQGTPDTMQRRPRYRSVVDQVKAFFAERLRFATRQGIAEERIILDPGIGFGKTVGHNVSLLKHLREFSRFGRPLLIGISRKSFIGRLLGSTEHPLAVEHRLEGTLAASLWSLSQGAAGFRVHDVQATRRALKIWKAIEDAA